MSLKGLSARTSKALSNEGIHSLEQLKLCTEKELLRIPNFGRKSLNELRERLAEYGLDFMPPTAPGRPFGDKRLRVPKGPLAHEAVFVASMTCQKHKELQEMYEKRRAMAARLLEEYYPEYTYYEIANLLGCSITLLQKVRDAEADNTTE